MTRPRILTACFCTHVLLLCIAMSQPLAVWRSSWALSLPLIAGLAVTSTLTAWISWNQKGQENTHEKHS